MKTGTAQAAEESPVIDVLVLYTQRVEDHEGGPAQTRATIENEMAEMKLYFGKQRAVSSKGALGRN